MKFELFSQAALSVDLKERNLFKGDVVTIIEYHPTPSGKKDGYSIEIFINALGDTCGVEVVDEEQLEPLNENEIFNIRKIYKESA